MGGTADIEHPAANNLSETASHESSEKELRPFEADIDVVHVTHERPYFEINFIGTYAAICLGALACYGGFIMPATSLALINEAIGRTP